jgi:short-subunit dehydrogenase
VAFAEAGHTVGLCARRTDRLEAVANKCGPATRWWAADLSDLARLDELAVTVDDALGGVDVLVNNAGIPKRRRVRTMSAADVEGVMAMNYFSPVRLTLAFLPRMLARRAGDIINVSSMGVHSAAFGVGAYAASKAALELFTESLYLELADSGVRAHLLVPGTTRTEFSDDRPGNEPSMVQGSADGATPEDVAAAIMACIAPCDGAHRFVSYAMDRDAKISAAKAADPNVFLAKACKALSAFR